jgi:O-methyltransferase involved in polyketide biosynthesis
LTRDFSTISPSARALLMVKAHTSLPYARQAAELVFGADAVAAAAGGGPEAERRRGHFALRARSLDDALDALGATRVLELAAGLSFRSLARAAVAGVCYVDTDLPELAALKAELVAQLAPPLAGELRVQALDALDADAMRATVDAMPPGELAIVHEGLLMYLDDDEKARLAANIRAALVARGGAWVTADVYVRSDTHLHRDARTEQFLAEHRVEERKFADWAAADAFFPVHGFAVERKLAPSQDPWRVRETWIARAR